MSNKKPTSTEILKVAETIGAAAVCVGAAIMFVASPDLRRKLADALGQGDTKPPAPTPPKVPHVPRTGSGTPVTGGDGVVYLLKAGPFFKIGKAQAFDKRYRSIKLALPYPTEVVHHISCGDITHVECYWHKRFASRRQNGEWFVLTDEEVARVHEPEEDVTSLATMLPSNNSATLIGTILKHDRKVTSYKIALIRALNDVALSFPDAVQSAPFVAVPLRMLAEFWVAYYWPFADARSPVAQGQAARREGTTRFDVSFRPALEALRGEWETVVGTTALPSDGFFLRSEFKSPRRRASYPPALQNAFDAAVRACADALLQPIRYAGEDEHGVFERPKRLRNMGAGVVALPGARPEDVCLLVSAPLWNSFRELSLWIEALCIHEWSLFTENLLRGQGSSLHRGDIYFRLTARPGNRRPLTWERNRIELLMMEGISFVCPWTKKVLSKPSHFDVDHLLPLAVYPVNELWNLLPADKAFNQHVKRDRVPSLTRLLDAAPILASSYALYEQSPDLKHAVHEDADVRFSGLSSGAGFCSELSKRTIRFLEEVATARGVVRF